MAINQNHLFEDIDGQKCAIVEKNVTGSRVEFLKTLLEFNHFTVVVIASPPPKVAVPAIEEHVSEPTSTFSIGVTDVRFNATNAIFGRLLKTPDGKIVTRSYWLQKDEMSNDQVPYFQKNN